MITRRRSRHGVHEHAAASHDRWLVSYADFITLLFAFFVVMFAISQVDEQKLGRFSESVQSATNVGNGQATPPIPAVASGTVQTDRITPDAYASGPVPGATGNVAPAVQSGGLVEAIRVGRVHVMAEQRGTVYRLPDRSLFMSGSARVSPDKIALLQQVGAELERELMRDPTASIRVEGHTDSRPTRNYIYRSNWELSAARAASVLSVLVEQAGVDPRRVSVVGYADSKPIGDNATEEGRTRNRRVEIVFERGPIQAP